MTEDSAGIDFANLPAPSEGIVVTLFITVRKVARSRAFYTEVLGGTVVLEENPCIVKLANSWILMNPGGPPTPDKPGITVVDYEPGDTTSIFLNLRVADIDACYRLWSERGANFLTPPIDRGAEIRCYIRDPDGYLIEVGQSTGLLSGHLRRNDRRTFPVTSGSLRCAHERAGDHPPRRRVERHRCAVRRAHGHRVGHADGVSRAGRSTTTSRT